jgi:hypothetical protein
MNLGDVKYTMCLVDISILQSMIVDTVSMTADLSMYPQDTQLISQSQQVTCMQQADGCAG